MMHVRFLPMVVLAACVALPACGSGDESPVPTLLEAGDDLGPADTVTDAVAPDATPADGTPQDASPDVSLDVTGDAATDAVDVDAASGDATVQTCTPNATWCEGPLARQCDDIGASAVTVADCSKPGSLGLPQTCLAGTCVTAACQQGQKVCLDAKTAAECKPDVGWQATPCADGNACTLDTCEGGACKFVQQNDIPCSDGSACTQTDKCFGSACVGGNLLQCDDQNACTADTCDPQQGCVHAPESGKPCLEDGNACTHDACEAGSCAHPPVLNGSSCADDGQPCTKDQCQGGQCTHPPADGVPCPDDGQPCTVDACKGGQCTHAVGPGPCQDGNECTENDQCQNGVCKPGSPKGCNDGNPCTLDTCDPSLGCVHGNQDGNACTTGSPTCSAGACWGGTCLPKANVPCQTSFQIGACPPQTVAGLCSGAGQCLPTPPPPGSKCAGKPCSGVCLKCGPLEHCQTF